MPGSLQEFRHSLLQAFAPSCQRLPESPKEWKLWYPFCCAARRKNRICELIQGLSDRFDSYRHSFSDQIAGLWGHPVVILACPFHIATDGIGQRHRRGFTGQDCVQGVAQFVGFLLAGVLGVVIHPAGVAQLALGVEYIKMRRAQRAVGQRWG